MTERRPPDGRPPNVTLAASAGRRRVGNLVTLLISLSAASIIIAWYHPSQQIDRPPFVVDSAFGALARTAQPAPAALGRSGALKLAFALPGERVDYPLVLPHDTLSLRYAWERISDSLMSDSVRILTGDTVVAPEAPGFYRLALVHGTERHVVDGLSLAVLVPFDDKHGAVMDGYRIGTYRSERYRADSTDRPEGFVKVMPDEADLRITTHVRLGDFLSHDGQASWPRFAAVDPRVLDKLELVLERVSRALAGRDPGMEVDVHSGFRTPAHNRHVLRAAPDSRHQYGDAVDVSIDADGSGRMTAHDARMVAAAVDSVEAAYPDLVGGLGVYTSRRYSHPYVHIDARGRRVRWHG